LDINHRPVFYLKTQHYDTMSKIVTVTLTYHRHKPTDLNPDTIDYSDLLSSHLCRRALSTVSIIKHNTEIGRYSTTEEITC
jgi:hypothetical protein